MIRITIAAFALLITLPISVIAEERNISYLFKKYAVNGTLVIASLEGKVEYVHNDSRAKRRYIPASTFKIPNTLIALEEGVISNDKAVIKWDGTDKGWPYWNQDQTLRTAFSLSCVWCYQEFAKQIGHERYRRYVTDLNYGNQKTGRDVTTFWLEGDLAISAKEQVDFLRKIYLEQLPFKKEHFKLLKDIMLVEETPAYLLRAKTGWAGRIGWYVGYLEKNDEIWLFASNIDIESKAYLAFRKKLVIESMKQIGLI